MQNRISGVFVSLFGIILLFYIIPHQTETVGYGWLKPATLPSIAAVIIVVGGVLHAAFPRGGVELDGPVALRTGLYFFIGIVDLWLMTFNYIVAAPLLMLVLMWMVGERRWKWLFIGVVLLPTFIWFCIDILLQRPLS